MAITKVTGDVIADNAIDHDQLANRYTASVPITSASTITIDTSSGDVFTWTAGHTAAVSFTNVKIGSTCTLVITGGSGSYGISFSNINGSSGSFRKISGTYSDTVKNLIEFKFISTSEAFYQISQEAT